MPKCTELAQQAAVKRAEAEKAAKATEQEEFEKQEAAQRAEADGEPANGGTNEAARVAFELTSQAWLQAEAAKAAYAEVEGTRAAKAAWARWRDSDKRFRRAKDKIEIEIKIQKAAEEERE